MRPLCVFIECLTSRAGEANPPRQVEARREEYNVPPEQYQQEIDMAQYNNAPRRPQRAIMYQPDRNSVQNYSGLVVS